MNDAPAFLIRITKSVVCITFMLCFIFFDKFSFEIGPIDRIGCFFIAIAFALVALIIYFVTTSRCDVLWFQLTSLITWATLAVFLLSINFIYVHRYNELIQKDVSNSGIASVQLSLQTEYYSTAGNSYVNEKSIRTSTVRINNQTILHGCGTIDIELGKPYPAQFHAGLLTYSNSTTKEITFTKEMLENPTSFTVDVYLGDGYSAVITVTVKKSTSLTPFELVFGALG